MTRTKPSFIAIALTLFGLSLGVPTFADDNLPSEPAPTTTDGHISWHEFRHDLGSYPQVSATMSSDGVVTLTGHAERIEKAKIENLARRIRGVSEIRDTLVSD